MDGHFLAKLYLKHLQQVQYITNAMISDIESKRPQVKKNDIVKHNNIMSLIPEYLQEVCRS